MDRARRFLKDLFKPVTIMLVPHSSRKTYHLNLPVIALLAISACSMVGAGYMLKLSRDAFLYGPTKAKLDYYTSQMMDLQSTIATLKTAEGDFARLFHQGSKEAILDNLNTTDSGAIDIEVLKRQIEKTIDRVGEIRDYLSQTRDLYRATPVGAPILDHVYISSGYGYRIHPIHGVRDFHTGIDFSAQPGTPVRATADGIVSFSGRSGGNGNLVTLEHGFGYQSFYAHNKRNVVEVGQVVKRGDIISYVGSTGSSTGPHVHYEIWKEGKNVDPSKYLKGGNY